MKWLISICTALTLALFSGCSSPTFEKHNIQPVNTNVTVVKVKPEWINGPSKKYDRLDYITSRAYGSSEAEAADKANANIARMFMVDIKKHNMSQQQALQTASYIIRHMPSSESELLVAAPEVDRVLSNINIVDTWHDTQTDTHHALAALARNIGKGYLRKQIQMLDTYTIDYQNNAELSRDHLTKMGMTALAWRAQQMRTTLQTSMQNIDLTRRGIKTQFDIKSIEKQLNDYINDIKIYPTSVPGDPNAKQMRKILSAALSAARLKPASEEQAEYIMQAIVATSIAGESGGWAVGQGDIKVVLLNNEDNKVRATKQWQLKVQGLDEESAKRRVLEKAEFALKTELRNILIEMSLGY